MPPWADAKTGLTTTAAAVIDAPVVIALTLAGLGVWAILAHARSPQALGPSVRKRPVTFPRWCM